MPSVLTFGTSVLVIVLTQFFLVPVSAVGLGIEAGASLSKTEEREGCHNSAIRVQMINV
jgi:hypothetical protein